MSPVEANCPACGAPIRFAIGSSIVVVCPNCRSVVARGDRSLEDLGKVAALADTGSPLSVGTKGKYKGAQFELTGRAQFAHEAGGLWDEWYASFPGDRWGWIAEAQGRTYITFARHLPPSAALPPWDSTELGHRFTIPGVGVLVVGEIGEAKAKSAEGEIPFKLTPGESLRYIDLTGQSGKFATLDYSGDEPLVYLGEEVTLDALGISLKVADEREPTHVGALQVNCPQCGGALDLKAPDVTERVACPYCNSLLDCTRGKLQFLEALKPGKFKPSIPLGAVGALDGKSYTTIGFVVRHVTIERIDYYWNEYLLYGAGLGFRWLVESDHQWSFVSNVPAGEVDVQGRIASYGGKHFRLFQSATALVDYVSGEFYWKVHVGEQAVADDYVHAPQSLSRETTFVIGDTASAAPDYPAAAQIAAQLLRARGEVNWSRGDYLTPETVAAAFKLPPLPPQQGIAPNQPFSYSGVYPVWGALLAAAMISFFMLSLIRPTHNLVDKTYSLVPSAGIKPTAVADETRPASADGAPSTDEISAIPAETNPANENSAADTAGQSTNIQFEPQTIAIDGHRGLRIQIDASIDNSWLAVEGDLFNEETGLDQPFTVELEYYHGSDSDGLWSEGNTSNDAYLTALPSGKYTLRLESLWKRSDRPISMRVRIDEIGPRFLYLLSVILLISIVPIIVAIAHYRFEKSRWEESEFSPYGS